MVERKTGLVCKMEQYGLNILIHTHLDEGGLSLLQIFFTKTPFGRLPPSGMPQWTFEVVWAPHKDAP